MGEIRLEGIRKVFRNGVEAVSDLDLEVPERNLTVLLGPSGCGKSTVLRLIAGLEEPTEGTIWIAGRDVTQDNPKNRDVAMVFQNFALYPHMTVFENIAFSLQMRGRVGKNEVEARVLEAARILGLEDMLKRRPRTLSDGQRQRVAMGRAIVRRPEAFLMDEPLSNLDAKMRMHMRGEIGRIQREIGTTTLYVTHDQTEAMTLGDVIAVMDNGRIQQVGSPADLYREPQNLFVASFVGAPAMNLVEAMLAPEDAGLTARFGSNRLVVPPSVILLRPGLAQYTGRQVILGIRPEDMEDAAFEREAPDDRRIWAVVDRTELLGSETFVHFTVDAPLLLVRDPRDPEELEADEWAAERPNAFLARVDPRSTAGQGASLDLVVRTERLHFFDPATGRSIT